MHTVKSPFFGCRLLLVLVFILHPVLSSAQSTLYQQYIEKYKDIAIREMQRYGIPASITLAQGLLESGAGTSLLAENANNRFGIKSGGNWVGSYFVKDD
ncbi:MAG: glucosaminidase domain-containing protein, partial [Alloprevotella sp.]|nr:glucosaminidase domain-containing protein [Alloprevotella sp.]